MMGGDISDKPKPEVHWNSWNPRYGARSYNAHEIEIEALDFAALEAAADIKLADPARMRLVSAINCYYSDVAYRADAPDAEDVRQRMSKLEKHARALAEWLAVKDSIDSAILHEAFSRHRVHPETLKPVLWHIVGNLQDALKRLRVKRGPPDDDPRRALLRTLHDIYRESEGLEVGIYSLTYGDDAGKLGGPFLGLVLALCCQVQKLCDLPDIPKKGIDTLARKVAREAPNKS